MASTLAGSAYVPFIGASLPDILCEQDERTVGNDNCVSFDRMGLQLRADEMRYHHMRVRVREHRYADATLAMFHGPGKLATYDTTGQLVSTRREVLKAAA